MAQDILQEQFFKNNVNIILRKRNIMYLEQLTTIDGKYLIKWKSLKYKTFNKNKRITCTPKFFSILEQKLITTTRQIDPTYVIQAPHLK